LSYSAATFDTLSIHAKPWKCLFAAALAGDWFDSFVAVGDNLP
jgi:hypothetical protein